MKELTSKTWFIGLCAAAIVGGSAGLYTAANNKVSANSQMQARAELRTEYDRYQSMRKQAQYINENALYDDENTRIRNRAIINGIEKEMKTETMTDRQKNNFDTFCKDLKKVDKDSKAQVTKREKAIKAVNTADYGESYTSELQKEVESTLKDFDSNKERGKYIAAMKDLDTVQATYDEAAQAAAENTPFGQLYTFNNIECDKKTNTASNYRTGPNVTFERVGTFPKGKRLHITKRCVENGWYGFSDGDNTYYICGRLVK
jgi:gas vesicle protein